MWRRSSVADEVHLFDQGALSNTAVEKKNAFLNAQEQGAQSWSVFCGLLFFSQSRHLRERSTPSSSSFSDQEMGKRCMRPGFKHSGCGEVTRRVKNSHKFLKGDRERSC